MTKRNFLIMAAMAFLFVAVASAAQEPTTGPSVEPAKLDGLFVFLGGGIITAIIEIIKKLTKATGVAAALLTGVVSVLATLVYFKFLNPMTPAWDWISFVLYAVIVFGESTGFFHFYQKAKAPTTT